MTHPPRVARAFALHLVCVAWILFVVVLAWARHRSLTELRSDALAASTRDRLEALFTLGQRESPSDFRLRSPTALLDASDPRLREFAFTNTFSRNPSQLLDDDALQLLRDPRERFRASLWLHCRPATPRRLTLEDLDAWFAEGGP